jgi:O-methyltransferase
MGQSELAKAYLDTVERALTFSLYDAVDGRVVIHPRTAQRALDWLLERLGVRLVNVRSRAREEGLDWPVFAQTMIGVRRLQSLRACAEQVVADGVPGDLIEAGVWRGGASILMRAVLNAYGCTDRVVVLADSFKGLPEPNEGDDPFDRRIRWSKFSELAVSEAEVRANFERYGLLDDQVRFVPGWFRDTMPSLAGHSWALIRLDGDMYSSTMETLTALYPGLSPGGFLIVDDYGEVASCRRAVNDFRQAHGIDEPIQAVDSSGVYWRRAR